MVLARGVEMWPSEVVINNFYEYVFRSRVEEMMVSN
jgi:hypothetical protein